MPRSHSTRTHLKLAAALIAAAGAMGRRGVLLRKLDAIDKLARMTVLFIDKTGFERRLYDFAYQRSLAYGIASVLMAMVLGWGASVAFRQRT